MHITITVNKETSAIDILFSHVDPPLVKTCCHFLNTLVCNVVDNYTSLKDFDWMNETLYEYDEETDKESYLGIRIKLLKGKPNSFFYIKALEQLKKKKSKFEVACLAYLEAIRLE